MIVVVAINRSRPDTNARVPLAFVDDDSTCHHGTWIGAEELPTVAGILEPAPQGRYPLDNAIVNSTFGKTSRHKLRALTCTFVAVFYTRTLRAGAATALVRPRNCRTNIKAIEACGV